MRYAATRYAQQKREEAYRFFVTDALRIITKNTAGVPALGVEWMESNPYADIIGVKKDGDHLEPGEAKRRICNKLRGGSE